MLCVLFISLLCLSFVPCSTFLCSNTNVSSCSDELWQNETEDACTVKRLGLNSSECQSKLHETPTRKIPYRGIIKIEPFRKPGESRTIFKITAHDITWNNFKIRFQLQNKINCMKREFLIKKKVPEGKILTYDCPWGGSEFEDQIIDFEYTYGINNIYDGKRMFLIHVPKYETLKNDNISNLSDLILFSYVETTDLYQLIYKIHTAPSHLKVDSYEIYVDFTKNNVTNTDGPHVRTIKDANSVNVIDFEYDTYGIPGEYVFRVRPYNCKNCSYSVSPVVTLPESSTIITIGIVGISCLIPIFMVTLYMYFKVESGLIPRVLLITSPANNAHKTVGKSLANLLTQKYNIPTMIDIIDIPKMPKSDENPAEWLRNAFECATHVLILMSDDRPVTSIYRNIDNLLFSLIQSKPNKICCTLKFPFTKETNLNVHIHRNFYLMKDYNNFINFLRNRGFLHRLINKVIRNDLYYDLRKQINNYKDDIIPISSMCIDDCDDEYNYQNEKNILRSSVAQQKEEHQEEEEEEEHQKVSEVVLSLLNNIDESKLLMDHSSLDGDDSDTQSIDSFVRSGLEEVS